MEQLPLLDRNSSEYAGDAQLLLLLNTDRCESHLKHRSHFVHLVATIEEHLCLLDVDPHFWESLWSHKFLNYTAGGSVKVSSQSRQVLHQPSWHECLSVHLFQRDYSAGAQAEHSHKRLC